MIFFAVIAAAALGCARRPCVVERIDDEASIEASIEASLNERLVSVLAGGSASPDEAADRPSSSPEMVSVHSRQLETIRDELERADGGRICRHARLRQDLFCDFDGIRVEYSRRTQRASIRVSPEIACEVPGRPIFAIRWGRGVTVVTSHAMGTMAFPVRYGAENCSEIGTVEYGGFVLTDVALVPGSYTMYAVDLYGGVYHWVAHGEGAVVALFRIRQGQRYEHGDATEGSEHSVLPSGIVLFPGGEIAVWGRASGWFSVPDRQFRDGVRFEVVEEEKSSR